MKKLCLIYNTAPRYRKAPFRAIDQEYDCDWFFALRCSKTNLYFRNCFFSHQSADRRGVCRRVCEVLECYEIMYIYGKNSIYNPNVA